MGKVGKQGKVGEVGKIKKVGKVGKGGQVGLGKTRPSKCPILYTTMIYGEKNLRQKERKFGQTLKLQQIVVISKLFTKIYIFLQNTLLITCKYTITTQKYIWLFVSLNFYTKEHEHSKKRADARA